MKVGDLVKYRAGPVPYRGTRGLVVEIANEEIYGLGRGVCARARVKWFAVARPYWVSQKNLEVVSEGR